MSQSRNNLCSVDREAYGIYFECGGRAGSLVECGFFKPTRIDSGMCYYLIEFVPPGSEYPEYKCRMCACVGAQDNSIKSHLRDGEG